MQIDLMSCASPSVAPASESTATRPEAGNTLGSFADLLDAVAEDQDESTPADGADEDEFTGDEWMTVPVIVPIVPVIPQDVVKIEGGEATSVEAIGEDVADADVDAPVPSVATSPDVKSFVADVPKPAETQQTESSAAKETSTPAPAPAIPVIDGQPVEIASDVRSQVAASDTKIETTTAIASKEPIAAEPTAKPATAAKAAPAPKTGDVSEVATAAATEETTNIATQNAVTESAAARAEAAANDTSSEPAPSPRGAAARFARAIERAIEHAVAPTSSTGENSQSSNQNSDGQPSFGEWIREQFPQLPPTRGHSAANPAFSFVAPAQHDVRVSGILASSAGSPLPNAPAMPNEHDVTLQLVQSLRMQFRDGIGEAVLRLKPEHLGSVSISLRVENGGLKANVQADMPAVRQWLESQQDTLRGALAEHGLRLDRFDVEPDAQRQQADDHPRDAQSTRRRQPRRTAQDDEPVFEVVV